MKTRKQLYGDDAAEVLRCISKYHCIRREQLIGSLPQRTCSSKICSPICKSSDGFSATRKMRILSTTSRRWKKIPRFFPQSVSYAITAYLKSSYPDATWAWCEEYPETIVAEGGKGRIQVFGAGEYNYGEVEFDKCANMKCSLIKVVHIGVDEDAENPNGENTNPSQNPVDPQIWFEQQGREVLERLISDLNAYGHRRLVIHENGDVTVMQSDKPITKRQFATVPERMYWNRLVKVFERSGVASEVQDDGIVVTW